MTTVTKNSVIYHAMMIVHIHENVLSEFCPAVRNKGHMPIINQFRVGICIYILFHINPNGNFGSSAVDGKRFLESNSSSNSGTYFRLG